MRRQSSRLFAVLTAVTILASFSTLVASAATVTPSDRVTNWVNVREAPSSESPIIGRLMRAETAELVVSVPHWHRVRLADGSEGFVSKAWTVVLEDPSTPLQFQVHFVDVGTGAAAIIDIGEKEVLIDGGDSPRVLYDYVRRTGIIDGDIELLVVTHADSDHWRGFMRLLGFDGVNSNPPRVLEFWEPGYDRDCRPLASYTAFISLMQNLPGVVFRRPLEDSFPPAVRTGRPEPFRLPSIPEVSFTLLHTASRPEASNNDCAYRINNASIVLMVEIDGFRFLFTGDANGKERDEQSPGTPGHVEEILLALEESHPGVLRADVLKIPHHGSETASTQAFIDKVSPQFAIVSSSTRHHLPRDSVLERYGQDNLRVILRTDQDRRNDNDHIVCFPDAERLLQCNYADVLVEN